MENKPTKKKFRDLPLFKKITLAVSFILRLTMLVAVGLAIWEGNIFVAFVSALALISSFFPALIERNLKITLPTSLEFISFLFIYAAIFLGHVAQLYDKIWWWDVLLHASAGVALGFFGFLVLYTLYVSGKLVARRGLIIFFAFTFALALGAIWEIFEFTLDVLFKTNNQQIQTGVTDTMYDLILDSVGALISVVVGYAYMLRRKRGIYFGRLVEKFFALNPKFKFKKNAGK